MGSCGIALAISIAAIVNFVMLCIGARTYLTTAIWKKIAISACRSVFFSGIMAGLVMLLLTVTGVGPSAGKGVLGLTVMASVVVGSVVYIGSLWIANAPEIAVLKQFLRKGAA